MNTFTCGMIGTGHMGGALARAICTGMDPEQVLLANRTPKKAELLAQELGCHTGTNEEVAEKAKFIFLGVKPHIMGEVLSQISPILKKRTDRFVLVSMAAGLTMERLAEMAGGNYPILRIMPNTPVAVGQGIVFYAYNDQVFAGDLAVFLQTMHPAGLVDRLEERLMDAGCTVAGCGPAFAAMFMEDIADGGVACGLPRDKAYQYAAQMMLGTAQLALQSGQHPAAMKDAVCSPGGATIRGVQALEDGAFRAAVIRAVCAAFDQTRKLGEN